MRHERATSTAKAEELVNGRPARQGDRPFSRRTGLGKLAGVEGDYASARAHGVQSVALLFETLGGFGEGVCTLLKAASDARRNKLAKSEYDEATWHVGDALVRCLRRAGHRGDAAHECGGGDRDGVRGGDVRSGPAAAASGGAVRVSAPRCG